MIVWTSKPTPIAGEPWLVVDGARWVIRAGSDGIEVCEQRRLKKTGEWDDCGEYYGVWFDSWRISYDCLQYEGPHRVVSLGFVRLCCSSLWVESMLDRFHLDRRAGASR